MFCFQTKNPNLGKFWRVLQWKLLVYVMAIWSILQPFDTYILWHLVNLWLFGIVLVVLVWRTKKNLATLPTTTVLAQ
jgi:hypothetical protein